MTDGIRLRILGDYGPFSKIGKSIGYEVTIGQASYLIDCGAPLFQQIGGPGLKTSRGLMLTHCHDDHKRWFTDVSLFNKYVLSQPHKVSLLTSETVKTELSAASGPAINRSLSADSKRIVDIAFEDYVDFQIIGPRAKYKIVSKDEGDGKSGLYVADSSGNPTSPETAKIIINRQTGRPRLLFKDPYYNEWVEPESFYSFSSDVFYEEDKNIYKSPEGFTIEAFNAPVWHGIPCIGLRFKTNTDTLVFSSDTAHDKELWEQLYSEKRQQHLNMARREFESAAIIYGDINDFIERTWSRERFTDAINSFNNAVVIHDIAVKDNIVHTDYRRLKNTVLDKDKTILTHSPDTLISEWVLSKTEKNYKVKGNSFFEMLGDKAYPLDADIYYKKGNAYYVGYKNKSGKYTVSVSEKTGLLNITKTGKTETDKPLYQIDLYEDINGGYFPKLEDADAEYHIRSDGRVELVEYTEKGSTGWIIKDHRKMPCRQTTGLTEPETTNTTA